MDAMVNKSPQNDTLLTKEDVRRWREERAEIAQEIEALTLKLLDKDKRLAAVAFLLGDNAEPESSPAFKPLTVLNLTSPEPKVTWRSAVHEILVTAGRGLAPFQISEMLKASDFKDRYEQNPNGVYNTISQLIAKGLVKKKGNLLYATNVLNRMVKDGIDVPTDYSRDTGYNVKPDTTAAQILKLLADFPEGLRGSEVIDKLRNMKGVTNSAIVHTNFVYTVLGRLVEREMIKKEGLVYKPLSK